MEKLVSSWYKDGTLPESFIWPPDSRPGKLAAAPSCKNIPVIDLGGAEGGDHTYIIHQILEASQEFGFFQVINHGISDTMLSDTMSVLKEFFELPLEDKASVYSEDPQKSCKLFSSSVHYDAEDVHLWRDVLRHTCHPLVEYLQDWPQQPSRYRELVGTCSTQVRKLALNILELISEGLGLGTGYFRNELSQNLTLSVNHYPPCPDPSLTLGLTKHCDPNLITILMQEDHVNGLQVFKDGEWMGVEPISHALVVNIGYQLQIISNGKLKSSEHRAVTNPCNARTSAGFFVAPSDVCVVEPARALVSGSNPQLYKSFQYKEFLRKFNTMVFEGKSEFAMESFKLQT
ncbi:unnamed protein product [Malus baccata var. baccata]